MIHQVFAVFDSKARCFAIPFFMKHEDLAVRAFSTACNDPQLDLFRHAEDFSLFHLGTFDDERAVFKSFDHPVNLGLAATFKGVSHASQS